MCNVVQLSWVTADLSLQSWAVKAVLEVEQGCEGKVMVQNRDVRARVGVQSWAVKPELWLQSWAVMAVMTTELDCEGRVIHSKCGGRVVNTKLGCEGVGGN